MTFESNSIVTGGATRATGRKYHNQRRHDIHQSGAGQRDLGGTNVLVGALTWAGGAVSPAI